MKDLGEALDDGDAALIIVGRSKLEEMLDRELKRANRRVKKQIKADSKELDKELSVLP
jgi:Sec-independent protein translocase protein TatA